MTEDPAIEAMCLVMFPPAVYGQPTTEALFERRDYATRGRAAIPIGSEWVTAEGVRVMVVPAEATKAITDRARKALEQQRHFPTLLEEGWNAMLAAVKEPQS